MQPGYRGRRSFGRWLIVAWVAAWAVFSFPWTSVTSTANWDRMRRPHVGAESRLRLHHVLNVLFYLPAAPLVSALGWPASAGIVTGAAMSFAAEGVQVFSTDRAPDGNDIVANIGGAAAGFVALEMYRRRSPRRFRNT